MKKMLIFILAFSVISSMYLFAGMPVSQDTLPKNALSFIQTNFANATISYVEKDHNEFDVSLSNGTEISFMLNGEWKDVKGYTAMPTGFIPKNIMNAIKKSYPQASVVEIEKKYNHFEIKLDNMMELYIDMNGSILRQKFDD